MNMRMTMCLLLACVALSFGVAWAGDLTVEGNLNVTSNMTSRSLSATNATVGSLVVNGNAVINGTVQGDGAGITNVPGAGLVSGSVTAGALASGAVNSAKIQDGTIADVDIAADAAVAQSKVAGLTNALGSLSAHLTAGDNPHGVTATQIGALTNEVDSIALAALAQYVASSSNSRWQDTAASNIFWTAHGGTNLIVYKVEPKYGWSVTVANNIYEYQGGPLLQVATNFSSDLTYPLSGGGYMGVNIDDWEEYGYGIRASATAPLNITDSYYIDRADSFAIICSSYWWEDQNSTPCVMYQYGSLPGYVTNIVSEFNLVTGDVWSAISSVRSEFNDHVTSVQEGTGSVPWQDSECSNIMWKCSGGTNIQTIITYSTSLWVCVNTDLYDYNNELVFAAGTTDVIGMPREPNGVYEIGNSGFTVSTMDAHVFRSSYYIGAFPDWASGNVGFYADNSGYTGTGSFMWITRTVTNVITSFDLTTSDLEQAISTLYPLSNPSNFVSLATLSDCITNATSNLLTTTGNGSQLTGITAAQVGAYTINQTDAAIAGALSGFNPGSCVQTNHAGDVSFQGAFSASTLAGNGAALTNLNLAAYVGSNLVWDAESNKLHAAASGPGYTDAAAVDAVTATHLNMHSNRVTNLAAPAADSDATTKAFIRQVLATLPPQGNLSMGVYTNGAPTTFPLSFDE